MTQTIDLYAILEVEKDAPPVIIKAAWRRLATQFHPDSGFPGATTEKFQSLQQAWEILSDPSRRAHYDLTGDVNDADVEVSLQVIRQILANCLDEVIEKLAGQRLDPVHADLAMLIRLAVDANIHRLHQRLHAAGQAKVKAGRLLGRFKVKGHHANHLEIILRDRIAPLDEEIKGIKTGLQLNQVVKKYLASISFDPTPCMEDFKVPFGVGPTTIGRPVP